MSEILRTTYYIQWYEGDNIPFSFFSGETVGSIQELSDYLSKAKRKKCVGCGKRLSTHNYRIIEERVAVIAGSSPKSPE